MARGADACERKKIFKFWSSLLLPYLTLDFSYHATLIMNMSNAPFEVMPSRTHNCLFSETCIYREMLRIGTKIVSVYALQLWFIIKLVKKNFTPRVHKFIDQRSITLHFTDSSHLHLLPHALFFCLGGKDSADLPSSVRAFHGWSDFP